MLRTFHINPTLSISETSEPDTVIVTIEAPESTQTSNQTRVTAKLTKKEFEELSLLGTSYGANQIRWQTEDSND